MNRDIHFTIIARPLFSLLLIVLASQANAQPTAINNCAVITQPGSYVLSNNITARQNNVKPLGPGSSAATCILITADFVTLDLGGFAITATNLNPNVETEGISTNFNGSILADHFGIYVHSGTVANFSGGGVSLHGHGLAVEHIQAVKNFTGIVVNSAVSATPIGNRIVDNTVVSNSFVGISLECPSVVVGNIVAGNPSGQIIESGPSPCTNSDNDPNLP